MRLGSTLRSPFGHHAQCPLLTAADPDHDPHAGGRVCVDGPADTRGLVSSKSLPPEWRPAEWFLDAEPSCCEQEHECQDGVTTGDAMKVALTHSWRHGQHGMGCSPFASSRTRLNRYDCCSELDIVAQHRVRRPTFGDSAYMGDLDAHQRDDCHTS